MGDTNGQVVAGGNGQGNRLDQLNCPFDVLIDKETDSLIICDQDNQRVVRWSRRSGTSQGEILIDNIDCYGLAMDDQRYLYISDTEKDEVRRYQIGDKNGTLVAGGNGEGAGLNQLNFPIYIFVDQQQTVYVSDRDNHRVMKWNKGAKEGIVVAGGRGKGNALTQLSHPQGLNIRSLFDIQLLSLTIDETEKFGILCLIEGQIRQHIFRVINENTNTSSHSSKCYFTDSMSSLLSISTLSNNTHHHGSNKTYSSLIQTSLENLDIGSDLRSINCLNLLDFAFERGLHKAKKRLSLAIPFSP
ncbi:unnamed protein product [Rotaria sordida]|uniref:Uncharacterized protein n=1 Tax=Rotaria sordida TaxID=392033 RepID=A0A815DSJ7_9BILA|nr:unnamed protein product [Rotaria sordida]CAF1576997.1 unnamed protein product [Rotaria sordida]